MSTAVSTSSIYQELQSYVRQRGSDLQQLGQALPSGDLAGAQQAFAQLESTFHSQHSNEPQPAVVVTLSLGSSASSSPAASTSTDAQSTAASSTAANSTGSSAASEIVLNLGAVTPGEQITIGLSKSKPGTPPQPVQQHRQQHTAGAAESA
jgi:hypothetical protein